MTVFMIYVAFPKHRDSSGQRGYIPLFKFPEMDTHRTFVTSVATWSGLCHCFRLSVSLRTAGTRPCRLRSPWPATRTSAAPIIPLYWQIPVSVQARPDFDCFLVRFASANISLGYSSLQCLFIITVTYKLI